MVEGIQGRRTKRQYPSSENLPQLPRMEIIISALVLMMDNPEKRRELEAVKLSREVTVTQVLTVSS